jgi:DNA-binding CsgD family transcriptional regulator
MSLTERNGQLPGMDRGLVAVLLEAGEQARLAHRPRLAADCFTLAFRSSSDAGDRATIRARLAGAQWRIDPAAAARHLRPLTDAMRADRLTERDSIVLVRHLLWHGRTAEAVDVLDRLRQAPSGELPAVESWLASTFPTLARPDDRQLRGDIDPWLRVSARLSREIGHSLGPKAAGIAERVLGDLHLIRSTSWAEEAALLAVQTLICADRIQTAAEWCAQLMTEAEIRMASSWQALFSAASAEIALRQGDLPGAAGHAYAAMTHMPPKTWGVAVGYPLASLILASTWMGHLDTAAKHVAMPVDKAMFESRYGLYYLYARGQFLLATDQAEAALSDFLDCGAKMRDWGLDNAGLIPWRPAAAQALLRLRSSDQARRMLAEQLGRPGMEGSRARGLALRQLAATGEQRVEMLTEALELFESCGDRLEQARVLADLSHAYLSMSENRKGRLALRRAWHLAKTCEAEPLCRELAATDPDGYAPVQAADISALSGSERRVASLAAMGYSNREIAAKLYITTSTVEQHLTRVYRKLKVKRRKELPVELCITGE